MENDNNKDNDISSKQAYLRKSILEKGYDAEKFLSHLINLKGEKGSELSNWQMDELMQAVTSFIEENGIIPSYEDEEEPTINNINHNFFDETFSVIGRTSKGDLSAINGNEEVHHNQNRKRRQSNSDYEFLEIIQCQKTDQTELSKYDHIQITISKYNIYSITIFIISAIKHQGGLFSKSYLTYEINTHLNNGNTKNVLVVRRRYSDFKWLRNILGVLYIGSSIPPLPKKLLREKWSSKAIEKTIRAYWRFLQSLVDDTLIKHSPILYDFLFIQKENEFFSRKTYYDKIKSPKTLNKIISVNGKIKLQLSASSENYVDDIKQHVDTADILLKRLTSLLSTLIVDLNHISSKMKDISDVCLQLYENSHKFDDNAIITDTYRVLSALMSNWSESEKKQSDMLQLNLRENIRFIRKECLSIKELHSKLEERQFIFYKFHDRLTLKKEELYKKGDIFKWGLPSEDTRDRDYLMKNKLYAMNKMLPKESAISYSNKRFYAYFINQFIVEFERIRKNDGHRYKDNFMILGKVFPDILNQLNKMWKDMIDFFNNTLPDSNSDN